MTRETSLDLEIMQLFLRNPYLSLSINQIASQLGKKYPNINRKANEMLQEGILKKQVIGRSHLCSLELANPKTRLLMGLIEFRRVEQEMPARFKELRERLQACRKELQVDFALLKGKELYLCTGDQEAASFPPEKSWQIHPISASEMSRHLLDDQILSDHLLLYGFDRFYEFINDHEQELRPKLDPLLKNDG